MTIIIFLIVGIFFIGLSLYMDKNYTYYDIEISCRVIGTILFAIGSVLFIYVNEQRISCNLYSKTYKTSFNFSTGCYVQINEDMIPLRNFEEIIKNKYNNPQKTLNINEKETD